MNTDSRRLSTKLCRCESIAPERDVVSVDNTASRSILSQPFAYTNAAVTYEVANDRFHNEHFTESMHC